ncbi:hypothetical protein BDW59DRAFT_146405 [Aspergillus cavernicola]|uniref:Uncharacterized protein n=1 Tax=Aspergillus cavernicola TaxID=176166 RepID=A0ABR4IC50_9EURO
MRQLSWCELRAKMLLGQGTRGKDGAFAPRLDSWRTCEEMVEPCLGDALHQHGGSNEICIVKAAISPLVRDLLLFPV